MLTHIVLFTLKDPADAGRIAGVLRAMDGRVPSLKSIEVGVDEMPSPRSAHVSLITRFDDEDGFEAYRVHPVHQDVLAVMREAVQSAVKVDYRS